MARRLIFLTIVLTVGLSLWPSVIGATGPWKAQIVDAKTGKPIEGVVVLGYWIRYTSTWAGWAGPEFYDAEEVVTGPDGRFVIEARATWNLLPWRKIEGDFVIFKPGYGKWGIRGLDKKPRDWQDLSTAEVFEKDDVVVELVPLKTREERLKFYDTVTWSLVPLDRTKRLREALDEERVYLGFRRMYGVKP